MSGRWCCASTGPGRPPRCAASLAKAVALPETAARVFDTLRAERTRLARAQGVPPYVVFQDATLRAMAIERPLTLERMAELPGIGQAKLERYGAIFLKVLHAQRQG